MNNLAGGYRAAMKPDKALPLLEETLTLRRAKLGPDHPSTLTSMGNLATFYWSMKRLDQSVPLFEQLLPLREKKLGRGHPDTQMTVANLGVNYRDAGRVKEAIPLLEEAYRASKKHPNLRWVGTPLVDAYAKAGRPAEAAKLIDELLAVARRQLPKDSPQLAGLLAEYGLILLELKGFAEAEPLLRECLAIREAKEPDDWRTFNTQSMLGGALLGQKKYADAEPLLRAGYDGMKAREKAIPPVGRDRIPEALDRLVELYAATGKNDEEKKWRSERAKYPFVAPPPRAKP
jgi:tetratricopeptide (TPR) repeat protein